jgi:hypothetical protein
LAMTRTKRTTGNLATGRSGNPSAP